MSIYVWFWNNQLQAQRNLNNLIVLIIQIYNATVHTVFCWFLINVAVLCVMEYHFLFQINGSVMPASVISVYCAYLCYTSLSSEPDDYECNGLHMHSKQVSMSALVLGMLTTVLSVVYSAVRAGSSTTFLSPPSSPRSGKNTPCYNSCTAGCLVGCHGDEKFMQELKTHYSVMGRMAKAMEKKLNRAPWAIPTLFSTSSSPLQACIQPCSWLAGRALHQTARSWWMLDGQPSGCASAQSGSPPRCTSGPSLPRCSSQIVISPRAPLCHNLWVVSCC